MQQANVYAQYKEQSLQTLTKGEVVVKLFEEASKQVSMAIFAISGSNMGQSFNCIHKAQRIIAALRASLDEKYPISKELDELYLFIYEKLGEANDKKDMTLLKDLLGMIDDFKVTFRQADRITRTSR